MKATATLPPRPNLGPEPWVEPATPWVPIAIPVAAGLLALIVLSLVFRRRRSRRVDPAIALARLAARGVELESGTGLIARAEAARRALASGFGPEWLARTTEETASDPELPGRLGPDRFAWLIDLLAAADRAKFDSAQSRAAATDDRTARSGSTGAGASSRISGK